MRSFAGYVSEEASRPISDVCGYMKWLATSGAGYARCGQSNVERGSEADGLSCALDSWFSYQWAYVKGNERSAVVETILKTLSCRDPQVRAWAIGGAEPGKRVYRGLKKTYDEVKRLEFTDRTTYMVGADYVHAVGPYVPTLRLQSWTVNPSVASQFHGSKDAMKYLDGVRCILSKRIRGDEVVFGPKATVKVTRHSPHEVEAILHFSGTETMTYLISADMMAMNIARMIDRTILDKHGYQEMETVRRMIHDEMEPFVSRLVGEANMKMLKRVPSFMRVFTAGFNPQVRFRPKEAKG